MGQENEDQYFPFEDDEEEEREPDYWACYCCGHTQVYKPTGFGCPRCTNMSLDPEYF